VALAPRLDVSERAHSSTQVVNRVLVIPSALEGGGAWASWRSAQRAIQSELNQVYLLFRESRDERWSVSWRESVA